MTSLVYCVLRPEYEMRTIVNSTHQETGYLFFCFFYLRSRPRPFGYVAAGIRRRDSDTGNTAPGSCMAIVTRP